MTNIFDLSDQYVRERAELDPMWATSSGVVGFDEASTDYSSDSAEAIADLHRRTSVTARSAVVGTTSERIARDVLIERLDSLVSWHDSGGPWRNLAMIFSPVQYIRGVFDEMPRHTNDDWQVIANRLSGVPASVQSYISLLRDGVNRGEVVASRQVQAVVVQINTWTGLTDGSQRFFVGLLDQYQAHPSFDRKVDAALKKAAIAADDAFVELGRFLSGEYAPSCVDVDGVGRDRYEAATVRHLGQLVDVDDAYQWGWDEMHRLDDEIRRVCSQISPGQSINGVREHLDGDFEGWIHGEAALVEWLQGLIDSTFDRLQEAHFDIPTSMRKVSVHIPPPGGALAPYYTPPTEDFSRPGTYWRPTGGRSRFPMWSEISNTFHEAVPGHHLLAASHKANTAQLSRFQRNTEVSGHTEGWCLYAERLMDELGYLERPEYRLDMLLKALFRAVRVVVDIGLHLGLSIPVSERLHGGQRWTPEIAGEYLRRCTNLSPELVDSEVDRYLGAPGQAISYKLGERCWLDIRDQLRQRQGPEFSLRAFHARALSLGPMGLDQLRRELLR